MSALPAVFKPRAFSSTSISIFSLSPPNVGVMDDGVCLFFRFSLSLVVSCRFIPRQWVFAVLFTVRPSTVDKMKNERR